MQRIQVVGPPGSGKTTTAKAIAERLGVPHLELDDVHWLPAWQERDREDFCTRVAEFAAQPRWIIDGNYESRLGGLLVDVVDTYIWLDPSRWRATSSVVTRTVRRSISRERLWSAGNRERLRDLLSTADTNLVLWTWRRHAVYRERYGARAEATPQRWVRLSSRREIHRFLAAIGPSPPIE